MSRNARDTDSALAIYLRLLNYVRPHWRVAAAAVVGMVLTGATEAAFAWLIKPMLDSGFIERNQTTMMLIPVGILSIFLIRGIGTFAAGYGSTWIARSVIARLRAEVFERLLRLPKRYYDTASSGVILSRLTYNVEQVAAAGTDAAVTIIRDTVTALFLLAYMAYISWRLALLFLLLGPVLAGVVRYISTRFRRLSRRIQASVGEVAAIAEEVIEGSDVIKVFGAQAQERRRFETVNQRNRRQFIKFAATRSLSTPVVQFCAAVALAAVVYLATLSPVISEISVGAFVSFITAMLLLMQPLKRLTNVHALIQKGVAAGESIFQIIDEPTERDEGDVATERVAGQLAFDDVHFHYANGPAVLRGVNLEIEAGETVALVGRSGSGKTSLANLLPRFYTPTAGRISLDGIGLERYALATLREQLAFVGQQVVLFNTSITANIAYGGNGESDAAAVRRAAEAAHALEFIERLPHGFDTEIGENGVMLSGGQRQRLAIARALYKDAPVLILDEATSSLDTESERKIQRALEAVMRGRTTLIIAHRLSTVENADRVVVLEAGRVVEQGSHGKLIAQGGTYASLHRLQFAQGVSSADSGH